MPRHSPLDEREDAGLRRNYGRSMNYKHQYNPMSIDDVNETDILKEILEKNQGLEDDGFVGKKGSPLN